jgi:hypothetical protein
MEIFAAYDWKPFQSCFSSKCLCRQLGVLVFSSDNTPSWSTRSIDTTKNEYS